MVDKFCSTCGTGITQGDAFCVGCGRMLGEPKTETSQAATSPTQFHSGVGFAGFDTATSGRSESVAAPQPVYRSADVQKVSTGRYWLAVAIVFFGGWLIGLPDVVIAFGLLITATVFVYNDAKTRGMDGGAWALGTFLLFIVIFPIYLLTRKPLLIA